MTDFLVQAAGGRIYRTFPVPAPTEGAPQPGQFMAAPAILYYLPQANGVMKNRDSSLPALRL